MISSKCTYALNAVLELAGRRQAGPVSIGEIARSRKIPPRFLEAILRELKQNGITESVRGKDGGYFLARDARQITVGQVVQAIEGPLLAPKPASGNGTGDDSPFSEVWTQAEAALTDVFNDISFHQLSEQEKEKAKHFVVNYSI